MLFRNPFKRKSRGGAGIILAEDFISSGKYNARKKELQKQLKEIEKQEKLESLEQQIRKKKTAPFKQTGLKLGESVKQFGKIGQREPDFSTEQQTLREILGGGTVNKMWGFKNNPVQINNDLHPSLSNPADETASLFGMNDKRKRRRSDTARMFGF